MDHEKIVLLMGVVFLAMPQVAAAFGYNYISAEDLVARLEKGAPLLIVDIQVEPEFAAHHIRGSVATYAYPVKSDPDRAKIAPAVKMFRSRHYDSLVAVCPHGKGGAKRAYDYLERQGIPEEKLLILTKGMAGRPYAQWVEGVKNR